jgi:hypothetical protein
MTLSIIDWRALSTGPERAAEAIGSILFVLLRFKVWPIATADPGTLSRVGFRR